MSTAGPVDAPRVWPRALAWLCFLGPFFFLSYGLANWWASQRAAVPSIVFDWERAIPFWAWTIAPYWTIDAFYAASLFVCATRDEVDVHGKRLLTAQLVAIACFVLVPLRFSFAQPPTDGLSGAMFTALGAFDRPFNQLPSLHVALAIIVFAAYARALSGLARGLLAGWFALICASVLTTYQHHFIDLPTGALLGVVCVWLWPWRGLSIPSRLQWTSDRARWRLAGWYAAGGAMVGVIALYVGGWALWLLWPATSLLLVAVAYAAIGAEAYQKQPDGALTVAAWCLFAPYVAGAWLNARAWTWRGRRPVAVADGVHLGALPSARELRQLAVQGIVDVTAELPSPRGARATVVVPMLDLVAPSHDGLRRAAHAIEDLRQRGSVLVCCALGCSRSACAVAAWLLLTGRESDSAAALARVRRAKAEVVLDSGHAAALLALAAAPSLQAKAA